MNDVLDVLFGGKTKVRILLALAENTGAPYHLRGLAQAAGTDSGNTSKLLRTFVDLELVTAAADRQSTRYALNNRSPLVLPLRQLLTRGGR